MRKLNVRRVIIGLAAAAVATGCTVKVATPPTTTTTTTTTTSTTTTTLPTTTWPVNPYQKYLFDVRAYTDFFPQTGWSDAQATGFADIVCGYFQRGGTNKGLVDVIVAVGMKNNMTKAQMLSVGAASAYAVLDTCPEYKSSL